MANSIVEIVKLPANEIMDGKPELYQECLKTLSEQGGVKNQWYSGAIEDPKLYHAFIEWNTYEEHVAFINSPQYSPFGDKLKALLSGDWAFCHVPMHPQSLSKALQGPVTSLRNITLKPGFDRKEIVGKFDAVVNLCLAFPKCYGAAWGFTEEDANKLVIIVSWESKEAHVVEFARTEEVNKELIPFFESEAVESTEIFHLNIKHYEPTQ